MQFKKVTLARIKHQLNNPPVGPALQGLLHHAGGETGQLFKEHCKQTPPGCSKASSAASSRVYKAPSSPISCGGRELAGLF